LRKDPRLLLRKGGDLVKLPSLLRRNDIHCVDWGRSSASKRARFQRDMATAPKKTRSEATLNLLEKRESRSGAQLEATFMQLCQGGDSRVLSATEWLISDDGPAYSLCPPPGGPTDRTTSLDRHGLLGFRRRFLAGASRQARSACLQRRHQRFTTVRWLRGKRKL